MEKELFRNYSQKERIEMLDANADAVEERTYYEALSDEEMTEKKSTFSQKSIEISRIEDEKKAANDKFKEKLKPLQEVNKIVLNEIKTGHQERYGLVYKIIDHEDNMVGFYSEGGTLIETRPATQEECRQLTIASSRRAANE